MFNKNAFKAKVVGAGMTLAEVAAKIGINPATLGRKMSGESDFTRAEIQKMRSILGMTAADADAIFFAE
jgi:transcriptional regulator with XRE-family HTH domain